MFSKKYAEIDIEIKRILANAITPSPKKVEEILKKSKSRKISLEEIAELLKTNEQETEKQFNLIKNFVYSEFRKEKNILKSIAPIYLSSHCIDTCRYCNYSAKRKDVKRTRLNLLDLEEELNEVISIGNKVIEFTLATDSTFTPKKLVEYIAKTKTKLHGEKGSGILLCSDYFSELDYQLLKDAGLWGMIQWDETLNKNKYQRWHTCSPRKSNFKERINNHDRALQAGLEVATGFLFGLSEFKYDTLMQIAKARYLEKEYGVKPFVFGTPRIKTIARKKLHLKNEVTNNEYEIALMAYKIAEPQIARWLQTRETPELNLRNMVDGDMYTYACGEVKPGGYKVNKERINSYEGGQFRVIEMTKKQFEQELRKRNFQVDYSWIKK